VLTGAVRIILVLFDAPVDRARVLVVTLGVGSAAIGNQSVMAVTVLITPIVGASVLIITVAGGLAAPIDGRVDAHVIDHAAAITSAWIVIIAVGITSAAAGDPLMTASSVGRSQRRADVNGADTVVDAILIATTATLDLNVRALMSLEIAVIDTASVVIVAVGVTSTAPRHGVVDAVSIRRSQTLTNILGADLVVVTGSVRAAAAGDVRSFALIGHEIAMLECASIMIVAVGITATTIGNHAVTTLTLFVAHVQRADVAVVAVSVAGAASFDQLALTTIGGCVAVLCRTLIVIIAVGVDQAAIQNRHMPTSMLATGIRGAVVVIIAVVHRVAAIFDLLVAALMSCGIAISAGASIAIVAITAINAAPFDVGADAVTGVDFVLSHTIPENTRVLLTAVIIAILIIKAAVGQM